MEYDLYHDESQEGGYWHGMLLIPKITRNTFLDHLECIRKQTKYDHTLTLKGLKSKSSRFNCTRAWIQLGAGSLMQYFKNEPYSIFISKRKYSKEEERLYTDYRELARIDSKDKIIGAKFILFKDRDTHSKMGSAYPDFASKIETTFRMGMLGGIHRLGRVENPIHLKSIHFDGHEHHKRNVDKKRIIDRIKGLRDYCSFDENIQIDDRTSKHNKDHSQDYEDCQFLQLTDLLVGGFRTILGPTKNKVQKEVSFPIEELVDKWLKGGRRMENSRWFRGFCLSECWLEDEFWMYGDFKNEDNQQKFIFR